MSDVASESRDVAYLRSGDHDTHLDPRFVDNPLVTGAPHVRFYAGQPLLVDGLPMGTLCVIDQAPRALDAADRDTLAQLGRAAVELLQSRRRLREAGRQRERLLDFARAAGDWMWESDAEHRLLWASDAFEAITGGPTAARIGQSITALPLLDERGVPLPGRRGFAEVLDRHEAFRACWSRWTRRAARSPFRAARCRWSTRPAASPATAAPRAT